MAKKDISNKGKDSLDDFDWPELDFGDMDQDGGKNDRSPITRVGKSALKAGLKTAIDPQQLERTASRVLPGAYGEAVKPIAEAGRQVKSLYDTGSQEVRETITDMRRSLARATPSFKGKVPDKLYDFIDKIGLADDSPESAAMSRDQQRQEDDTGTLDQIFGKMAEQNKLDRETREAEKVVLRTQAKKRFATTIAALQSIDYNLGMQRDYQENIDVRWKRETLRQNLRQTHLLGDLVELTMRSQKDIVDRLGMITKNTALPEAAKIQQSEEFKRLTSQRLLGKVSEGLFGNTADYLGRTFGNLSTNLREGAKVKLSALRNNFRDATDIASQMSQGTDSMGPGMAEQSVMELLFGLGSDYASNRWGKSARDQLNKVGVVNRNEGKIRYWLENGGRRLHEEAHVRSGGFGFKDWLLDMGRSALDRKSLNGNVNVDLLNNQHMPDNFNRMTNRSLIEIIPGLLARIHQEQRRMRLGREDVALIKYNTATGTFTDMDASIKDVRNRLVGTFETERNQKNISEVLKKIDPKGELRPSEREALSRHIVGLNMRGFSWNPTKFASGEFHGKVDPAIKERLQEHVRKRYNLEQGSNKLSDPASLTALNRHSKLINQMGPAFKDPTGMVQDMIAQGRRDELIELGVIDISSGTPVINYERMTDFYLGKPDMVRRGSRRRKGTGPGSIPSIPLPGGGPNPIEEPPIQAVFDYDRLAQVFGDALEKSKSGATDSQVLKEILDAVKANNQDHRHDYTNLALEEIVDVLMDGRQLTYVAGFSQGDRLQGPGNRNWKDKLKAGFSGLQRQGQRAWDFLGGVGKEARRNLRSGYETARGVLGTTYKGAKGYLDDRIGQVRAIYVKGRDEAILKLEKLQMGHYVDELTGKVITRMSDIKGRVKDLETGDIVIDWDDLKKGFYDRSGAEYVVKGVQRLWEGAMRLKARAMGGLSTLTGGLSDIAGRAGRWVKAKLKLLPDVYVAGESDPRLLKVIMDNGGYLDKKTKKPIQTLDDIKGDIIDINGNLVLSLKDMRKGLVDKWGRPIRGGFMGVVDKIARVGRGAYERVSSAAAGLFKKARDFSTSMFGRVGGLFGRNLGAKAAIASITAGLDGTPESIQKAQLMTQLQILENVIQLNPGRNKVWGDASGDGVRDGSYLDQMKRRVASTAEKVKGKVTGSNAWGSLMGAGAGIKEFFSKMFGKNRDDEEGDEGGSDYTYVDMGGDGKKRRSGRNRGGKRGFLRRGWDKLANSRAGNFVKGGLGRIANSGMGQTVGRGLGAMRGMLPSLGGAGIRGAADGLLGRLGIGALLSGGVGATLATAGGAILTGLAGLIASPVVIGGAIIAGAGLAAYGAYRLFRTESRDMPLCKLRLAHYGWDLKDNDQAKKFLAFEALVMGSTKFSGSEVVIDLSDEAMKKAADIFGVDLSDEGSDHVATFAQWIEGRFKPVFSAHISSLASNGDWKQLGDIDSKLDANKKRAFVTSIKSQGTIGPACRQGASPFGARHQVNTNLALIEQVLREAEGAVKEQAKSESESFLGKAASYAWDKGAMLVPWVPSSDNMKKSLNLIQEKFGSKEQPADAIVTAGKGTLAAFQGDAVNPNGRLMPTTTLDALRAVRFKAYGLTELERNMIRGLIEAEQATARHVTVGKDGIAEFRGNAEDMVDIIGPFFGVDAIGTPSWSHFLTWYESRFLPVYLKHYGFVKYKFPSMDPAEAHKEMAAEYQYELAMEIVGTTTSYGGKGSSIWSVPLGPNIELRPNTDRASVNGNLEALKDGYTQKRLDEESGKAGNSQSQKLNKSTGLFESVKKSVSSWFGWGDDKNKSAAPGGGSNTGTGAPTSAPGSASTTSKSQASGMSASSVGGAGFGGAEVVVDHPGGGTEGDVNKLAFPRGVKGFEAHKELLAGVAAMTGFPADLLAGVIATESSFDSSAKPGTSAAQGLGQFIPGTWSDMMRKYARKFGIAPGTPATDPRANALMTVMYMKENAEEIKKVMGPGYKVTDVDLYMAHFLGAGGYKTFLRNPGKSGADLLPQAASSNQSIFYENGRPRTVEQIIGLLGNRVTVNRQRYAGPMAEYASTYTLPGGNADGTVASLGETAVAGADAPVQAMPAPTAAGLSPIKVDMSKVSGAQAANDQTGPQPGVDVTALREASNTTSNIASPPSAGPIRVSSPAISQSSDSGTTPIPDTREQRAAQQTLAGQKAQRDYQQKADKDYMDVAKDHLGVSRSMDKKLETIIQLLQQQQRSRPQPTPMPMKPGPMSMDKNRDRQIM